ncbi:MAG: permease prefix domain 2-containing transporter [Bacteroidota bacterium]
MKEQATKPTPPRWATKLLRAFCASHLLEEVQGDLQEEFDYQVWRVGKRRARLDYIRNVLGFFKPFALKRKSAAHSNYFTMNMVQHYWVVAFRNVIRNKSFSLINIVGLALGMTCCLFIFLWVRDERSVDNFHSNGKTLYSVYQTTSSGDRVSGQYATNLVLGTTSGSETLLLLAEEIKKTIPEIKYSVSYATGYELPWGHPETFQAGERIFKFEGSRAGEDFFKMLSYPVLAGDPSTALKGVSSIAVSGKMASMLFNSPKDALGKSVRFENSQDFIVTAVFEDVSPQSTLKFDYLIAWDAFVARKVEVSFNYAQTFVQLEETADVENVREKMKHFLDSRIDRNGGFRIEFGLQQYGDQYLVSNFENGHPQGGRIEYVRIFSGVAIFILLMACINFMNLATARSVKRAKEVGVRKVVGSSHFHLVLQFFGESVLFALLAFGVSLALVKLLLPAFNSFTGKQIVLPTTDPVIWLLMVGFVMATGLVAGSYPALFLSSLKPVRILKGVVSFTSSAVWFRKGLATFQFVLSITLLIATIVVSRQTDFVRSTNLGYDRENLLYIRIEGQLNKKYEAFRQRASAMPGIRMVDRSSEAPHSMGFTVADAINWEGKGNDASVGFKPTSVGFDFLKLMNLKLVEGRDFSRDFATDTSAFMINEEALKQMGMKDPIGKWISAWGKKGHIIAVLKDYHTNSLHEPIRPLLVDVKEDLYFGIVVVRTEPGKTTEALASLEKAYHEINPDFPFAYQFVDEEFAKIYNNEQVMSKLSNVFAIVAIMISCLGLLGLVMFTAEQRTKEFGIRKVLGATVTNIAGLLSKDFIAIIAVSFLIAAPIAGYFMDQWLAEFAFRIELSWWIFALSGAGALFIALLTISVQAIQSALNNPVKSLRTE